MIRDRLKELEIRITELADYLQISRTTLYKFIEMYDSGKQKDVNPSVRKLFDFIENNELIGKKNVIGYILENMTTMQENDVSQVNEIVRKIKTYVSDNPTSEKTQFLEKCVSSAQFDMTIHYLMDISSLLKKKKLSDENKEKLKPYLEIIEMYKIQEE